MIKDFMRMIVRVLVVIVISFLWLCRCLTRRRVLCLAVIAALVVVGAVFAVVLHRSTLSSSDPVSVNDDDYVLTAPDPITALPPSPSILGRYKQAAVVSNGLSCAEFGK